MEQYAIEMLHINMVTADLIDNNKWDGITELCKKSRDLVEEARA